MPEALHLVLRYGYPSLALLLLMEALGFPIPGSLVLLTAGAGAATGVLDARVCVTLALCAMLTGDTLLYLVGRHTGWALLGFLCRLSLNPESCILRGAESFHKRGRKALLFAKFIPGINTMAPPLAGSMNMDPGTFFLLDFGGALLYTLTFFATGFVFSEFLKSIITGMQTFGKGVEWLLGVALAAYLAYRIRIAWKHKALASGPGIEVNTVAELAGSEAGNDVMIADVRSHGYYDRGALRIRGSVRLDPNALMQTLNNLPKDKKIFLYCT